MFRTDLLRRNWCNGFWSLKSYCFVISGRSLEKMFPRFRCWLNLTLVYEYKKAELSQRLPRDAPYIGVLWKFFGSPEIFHRYFFRLMLSICAQNFKFVALPVYEIGYPKNWGSPKICLRCLFTKNFNGLLLAWNLWMFCPNFIVRSFIRSWDNSDCSFGFWGGGCEPSILGKSRP